jgi:P-type conjugative transfer protein TrbJ
MIFMSKWKKSAGAVAAATAFFWGSAAYVPAPASAMVVYDPTNHSENLANKLQLIKSYEKQLQQFDAQLKQLAKLDPSQLSSSVRQVQEMVTEMNKIRTSVNAIGTDFRTAMTEFDNNFTDYTKWNGASAQAYADQADRVNKTVEKGIKQSILSQGLASPEEMQKTTDSLSTLLEASQNAEGIVGVTQAASQIAGLQVKEMQRLEAIVADSMKGQNLYLEKMIQSDEASARVADEFYQTDDFHQTANASVESHTADFQD